MIFSSLYLSPKKIFHQFFQTSESLPIGVRTCFHLPVANAHGSNRQCSLSNGAGRIDQKFKTTVSKKKKKSSKPHCPAPGGHALGQMPPPLLHRTGLAPPAICGAGCGAALPPPSRALLRAGRRPAVPRLPPQVRPPRQPARPHQALRVLRCRGARAA